MKLSTIILEDNVDLTPLNQLDDLIAAELEKATGHNPNESIIVTAAVLAALPGILKSIDKIGRVILNKAGINLSKKEPSNIEKAYNVIIATADKIDTYLDGPFRLILKPFIEDVNKRNKVAGALKASVLAIMSIGSSIDLSAAKDITSAITSASPEIGKELVSAAIEKNGPQITKVLKAFFKSLK
jgi:hypothetical protein